MPSFGTIAVLIHVWDGLAQGNTERFGSRDGLESHGGFLRLDNPYMHFWCPKSTKTLAKVRRGAS